MPIKLVPPDQIAYVDTADGRSAGSGSRLDPVDTLATALTLIPTAGGTVRIRAGSLAKIPLTTMTASVDITLENWDSETYWYSEGLRVEGTGIVTLRYGDFNNPSGDGVRVGKIGSGTFGTTGRLVAYDCRSTGGECGWASTANTSGNVWTSINLTRCVGSNCGNDGFNAHGPSGLAGVMTLTDCTADSNDDEGASPHDDCIMHIIGGEFTNNAQSGMTAVNDAECNISGGALFDGNGTAQQSPVNIGNAGATWYNNASGGVDGATFSNNDGSGLYISTTGTVTLGTYTSTGNGDADVIP